MYGYRNYVAACCRGTTLAALLWADPMMTLAQVSTADLSAPSLGAHTLLTHGEGLGKSPALSAPIATTIEGSSLLVFNGGYASNDAAPTDSYGNRWKQLGSAVPFGNGYGDRFNVKAYLASNARGGAQHTVSIDKRGNAVGEISIPIIEIRHAVLHDMAQNYVDSAAVLTSGKVTTTGPATLIALWWGDGGIKRMTAIPDNDFEVIDSFLQLPDESGVQCAVAYKQVTTAGTYSVSWTGTPMQGAMLWLLAFQSR